MKLKIKSVEWAILFAVLTGVSAGCFVGDSRVMQAITVGLVTGFIVMSWEMVALHREVRKLRETLSKRNV